MKIKGILFDAGGTLVRPIGGSYWPGPYFHDIAADYGIRDIDRSKMEAACDEGMVYLEKHHHVMTEDEERQQFFQYYTIVLKCLGHTNPPEDFLQKLADAAVDKLEMELYPETLPVLEKLDQQWVRLGVVSNAWPSLERKFHILGIGKYFGIFVISSQIGCWKPAEPVYMTAIEKTGLPAENLLFIDDVPEYAKKARELGMAAAVMDRRQKYEPQGIPTISNLREVKTLLRYYEGSS